MLRSELLSWKRSDSAHIRVCPEERKESGPSFTDTNFSLKILMLTLSHSCKDWLLFPSYFNVNVKTDFKNTLRKSSYHPWTHLNLQTD